MIKRYVNIIIASLLTVSAIGVVVNKHYSGDKLFSTAIFGEANSCCEEACNCCSEETEYFHLDIDKILEKNTIDFFVIEKALLYYVVVALNSEIISFVKTNNYLYQDISPPNINSVLALLQVYRL